MLRLPEGKATQNILQTKVDAFGFNKNMIVTMDMAGPLPETLRGNKHILAMCDRFTKHIKVFPMKGQTAKEVSEKKCFEYCMIY